MQLNWTLLTADEREACAGDYRKEVSYGKKYTHVWIAQGKLADAWHGKNDLQTNSVDNQVADFALLRGLKNSDKNRKQIWGKADIHFAQEHALDFWNAMASDSQVKATARPLIVIAYYREKDKKYADNLKNLFLGNSCRVEQAGYAIITAYITEPENLGFSFRPASIEVANQLKNKIGLRSLGGSNVVMVSPGMVDSQHLAIGRCGGVLRISKDRLFGVTTAHQYFSGQRFSHAIVYATDSNSEELDFWNPTSTDFRNLGTFKALDEGLPLDRGTRCYSLVENSVTADDWLMFEIGDRRYNEDNLWWTEQSVVKNPLPLSEMRIPDGCKTVWLGENYCQVDVRTIMPTLCTVTTKGRPEMVAWAVEGVCEKGTSGTWVLDPTTNTIIGVIFAANKDENCSYLIPASHFFGRIHNFWKIRIPNINDMFRAPDTSDIGDGVADRGNESYTQRHSPVFGTIQSNIDRDESLYRNIGVTGISSRFAVPATSDLFQDVLSLSLTDISSGLESSKRLSNGPQSIPVSDYSHSHSGVPAPSSATSIQDQQVLSDLGLSRMEQDFVAIGNSDWVSLLAFVRRYAILDTSPDRLYAAARALISKQSTNFEDTNRATRLVKHGVLLEILLPDGEAKLKKLAEDETYEDDFLDRHIMRYDEVWKEICRGRVISE